MPLSVVTVRDGDGAPTSRDVYADGVRYRIGNPGLEILSAQSRVLGLYPSGNWLSVYRDDCVRVVTGSGPIDSDPPPASASPPADADIETPVPPDVSRYALDTVPRPASSVTAGPVTDSDTGSPTPSPVPSPAPSAQPARTAGRHSSTPRPGLRQVVFTPRVLRRPQPAEPASPRSGLIPLVFTPKIYRAARSETPATDEMPTAEDEPQTEPD